MASIFELESPTFARETSGITVVAAGNEATTLTAAQCVDFGPHDQRRPHRDHRNCGGHRG